MVHGLFDITEEQDLWPVLQPTTRGKVSCFGFIYENVWSLRINSRDNQYNTVPLLILRYENELWFPFKHWHKESVLAELFPFLSSSLCLSPQKEKKTQRIHFHQRGAAPSAEPQQPHFPGYITQPADCERWCTRTPLTGSHKPTCLSHPGLIQFHCHSRGNSVCLCLLAVHALKEGANRVEWLAVVGPEAFSPDLQSAWSKEKR